MATRPLRFDFVSPQPSSKLLLTTHHEIPIAILGTDYEDLEASDPDYTARVASYILPFLDLHNESLLHASNETCAYYHQSKARGTAKIPLGIEHGRGIEPNVRVMVVPNCGTLNCEMICRQQTLTQGKSMEDSVEMRAERAMRGLLEKPRRVEACCLPGCYVTIGTKLCGGCKIVAYCSKEHQKRDWKMHKKICAAWKDGKKQL